MKRAKPSAAAPTARDNAPARRARIGAAVNGGVAAPRSKRGPARGGVAGDGQRGSPSLPRVGAPAGDAIRTRGAARSSAPAVEADSLTRRIRAEIEQRILSGEWRPGDRIPVEHELMDQYGCSRMTVNKAIASLAEAGLIVRRRRAGSFVAQPRIHSVVLEIPDIQAEITARGEEYGLKLLARRRRKPLRNRADEVELAGKGELLEVRCLHLADGRPFAVEDRLISLDAVPDALGVDFAVEPPGTWLLGHVPWTQAEHRITAVNADRETAELLDIEEQAACLALERRTWRASEHITHVRQVFPGTHYDLVARFAPKGGGAV